MAQNTARLVLQRVAAWNAGHPSRRIDPQAELVVAAQEGLSGGIGDGGHAFGPNQLNNAGGVLTGKFAGMSPEQINQWAWSPAGIDYALAGIANVAGGETGRQAVSDIVGKFERPANPSRETANALAAYGGHGGGSSPLAAAASGQQPQPQDFLAPVRSALQQAVGSNGLDRTGFYNTLRAALHNRQQASQSARAAAGGGGMEQGSSPMSLALAAIPNQFATRGGIQVDSRIVNTVDQLARQFGVKVNSGYRSPQHNAQVGGAANSDHLRGDAVDFTGSPAQMAALYQYAQGRFPYTEPMAQAQNHVHVSFIR